MGVVVPLNCGDWGPHARVACNVIGGISAFAWIGPDALITDFTNDGEWGIDILSGAIVIVKDIGGDLPNPTPVNAETGLGCGPKIQTVNQDYVFNWTDNSRSNANSEAYSKAMLAKGRIGLYNCNKAGAPLFYLSRDFATFSIGDPVGNQDTITQYNGVASWNHLALLEIITGVPEARFQDVLP